MPFSQFMWRHNDMHKSQDTPDPIPFESFDNTKTKEGPHF